LIPHLLKDPFKRFRVANAEPDARYRIRQFSSDSLTLPPLDSKERERLIHTLGFPMRWLDSPIFRSPDVRAVVHRCLDQPDLVHISLAWNRAVFRNFARNEVDLFYPPERQQDIADPIFVAGYRNLIGGLLPNFSAVMIHGAAVVREGVAAVFLASDEGGKTTVVSHANGARVLNDDHLILRQEGGTVMAHGTPLGAITTGPDQARLGGFFLLEKSSHFDLVPSKPQDILQFLWNEHLPSWYVLPKSLSLRAFELLYTACQRADVYRMRFQKDYVDWDAIDAAMLG
jgi:hypothetical protein